ncbi:hypothetical protein Pth03_79470 [Planotetraspora thailandica]|uniref:Uncharacterized protein n=1 Tax=Planotetraspora thailandica TaxID=487172 RepID=A0A8J3Y2A8_9ACTN|nr:hypothetical protein [Planotetraspora thailandica]GII59558.1 hypothetical protein Pth03_79470 [Planotetraspora thailandica]
MSPRACGLPGGGLPSPRWSVVAVLAALAGCVTGAVLCLVMTRSADAYGRSHRQVTAQIVRIFTPPPGRALPAPGLDVELTWTGADGRPRTGRTHLGVAASTKSPLRVWVDREDRLDVGPAATGTIALGSVLGGAAVALAVWPVMLVAQAGRRAWTARRAMAGWEREWRDISAAGR